MGEKFAAIQSRNGSLTIPLPFSPVRSGSTPALPCPTIPVPGMGLSIRYLSITRRTDRGLRYLGNQESDVYILSGAEDLVTVLEADGARFEEERDASRSQVQEMSGSLPRSFFGHEALRDDVPKAAMKP